MSAEDHILGYSMRMESLIRDQRTWESRDQRFSEVPKISGQIIRKEEAMKRRSSRSFLTLCKPVADKVEQSKTP